MNFSPLSHHRSPCVILVPIGSSIEPGCEEGLRELERRGYAVWRVRGYSAVDAARNQLATDALARGYQELMFIHSNIVFHPDDVDRRRSHNLPFTCGIYPKKGPRSSRIGLTLKAKNFYRDRSRAQSEKDTMFCRTLVTKHAEAPSPEIVGPEYGFSGSGFRNSFPASSGVAL